ncbi:MAG: hypothetical protein WBI74_01680 [Caldicoprobacterales bacterium]|jgi:hypothetical protein|nr:hypothetical protein [Clostridiales bacterium]
MRKNYSHKSLKSFKILTIIMVLAVAMLISSCTASFKQGQNQVPLIDPIKATTDKPIDKPEEDESDNLNEAIESNEADNEEVKDSQSVNAGDKVKEFDAIKDMQLGSLKADMPKAEVEKVMKSELVDTVIKEEYGMETEIQTYKDGTVINLLDDKIYSIKITSSDYATPRGLKIGDREETLRKLYGEPSAIEDGKWIYSSRGYDMFFVTVKDGIVVEIMISQVL